MIFSHRIVHLKQENFGKKDMLSLHQHFTIYHFMQPFVRPQKKKLFYQTKFWCKHFNRRKPTKLNTVSCHFIDWAWSQWWKIQHHIFLFYTFHPNTSSRSSGSSNTTAERGRRKRKKIQHKRTSYKKNTLTASIGTEEESWEGRQSKRIHTDSIFSESMYIYAREYLNGEEWW